jgi:hypothetical protein
MREYGKVYTAFWQDPSIRSMPEDARSLALYLLTCPHANSIGLFRLPDAYAADDMQWPIERVSKGFRNLSESGFIVRENGTGWLAIANFAKWNRFENRNVASGAMSIFDSSPDGLAKSRCARAILEFGQHLTPEQMNRLETVSKGFRNPEPSQSLAGAKPEPEPEPEPSLSGTPAAPAAPPAEKPAAETWRAYSEAYEHRYGAPPKANATVMGQVAAFVKRIGRDEAPAVAAFYVEHSSRWYAEKGHAVGAMLSDAEKLRTEWATGRRITATQARQGDRLQATGDVVAKLLNEAGATNAP